MAGEEDSSRRFESAYWSRCIAAVVVVALVLSLPVRTDSRLVHELENSGHAVLFGIAAIVFLRRWRGGLWPYLLAGLVTIALGAATELMQWIEGGNADSLDVVRDGAGALAFLGFAWTLRRRDSILKHYLIRSGSIALILIVFLPPILTCAALAHRWLVFPVIADFRAKVENRFWSAGNREVDIVPAPWQKDGRAARLLYGPAEHPGLAISGPWPDWSGYRELSFLVYSECPETVMLTLRIHDAQHNNKYEDRFNTRLEIHPGLNPIEVPLSAVREAPRGRQMDFRRIRSVFLFMSRPGRPFNLYFGAFTLR